MKAGTRIIIANAVGIIVLALGMFGIDVDPEQQAQIIAGLGAIGCLINTVLAAGQQKKQADAAAGTSMSQRGHASPRLLALMAVGAIAMAALAGCVAIGESDVAKLSTQYATLKFIEADPGAALERATRVHTIASAARDLLTGDPGTTVQLVETAVRQQVPWNSLDASDQLLADALISAISRDLQAQVGAGGLAPEQRLQVAAVLDWVVMVCERQLALADTR